MLSTSRQVALIYLVPRENQTPDLLAVFAPRGVDSGREIGSELLLGLALSATKVMGKRMSSKFLPLGVHNSPNHRRGEVARIVFFALSKRLQIKVGRQLGTPVRWSQPRKML
jgi:hypothetical protein